MKLRTVVCLLDLAYLVLVGVFCFLVLAAVVAFPFRVLSWR